MGATDFGDALRNTTCSGSLSGGCSDWSEVARQCTLGGSRPPWLGFGSLDFGERRLEGAMVGS